MDYNKILDSNCQDWRGCCEACPFNDYSILCDYAYESSKSDLKSFREIFNIVKSELHHFEEDFHGR